VDKPSRSIATKQLEKLGFSELISMVAGTLALEVLILSAVLIVGICNLKRKRKEYEL